MAVNLRPRDLLQQARLQRVQVARYLKLDGGRYLIAAALLFSLMGLLTLGQTGRLATKGYELAQLQSQQTVLLREQSSLRLRLSEAQALSRIERRALDMGLRPLKPEQTRYVTVKGF